MVIINPQKYQKQEVVRAPSVPYIGGDFHFEISRKRN